MNVVVSECVFSEEEEGGDDDDGKGRFICIPSSTAEILLVGG